MKIKKAIGSFEDGGILCELDDEDFKKVIDEHRKDKDDVNNRESHGHVD